MRDLMAYIDPATTALIWQILAGFFITMGVVLGIWWTKISTFFASVWVKIFGKKKKKKSEGSEAASEGATEEEEM